MPLLLIAFLLQAFSAIAFQPALNLQNPYPFKSSRSHNIQRHDVVVFNSNSDDLEGEGDEFILTPGMVTTLRKEASKRKGRRELPAHFLPSEEGDGAFSGETLSAVIDLLREHELVEVRGISKDQKRNTRSVSDLLASTLEREAGRPIILLSVKGFSATFYSPMDDEDPRRIVLRTSYVPGKWKKKPKALRDNRGQIIKDEDGNIVRE